MMCLLSWRLAAIGLLAVAACRSGDSSGSTSAPASSATSLAHGGSIVLIANLGEAEDSCGCGQIIRDVRAAASKGVSTKEIDTRTNQQGAKEYRVLVVPAVLFLDASGKELRRYEGESSETVERLKIDLGTFASAKN